MIRKECSTFHFEKKVGEKTISIILEVDYGGGMQIKTCRGDDSFKFDRNFRALEKAQEWLVLLDLMKEAVEFGMKELVPNHEIKEGETVWLKRPTDTQNAGPGVVESIEGDVIKVDFGFGRVYSGHRDNFIKK